MNWTHVCGSSLFGRLSVSRYVVLVVSKTRLSEIRVERVHEGTFRLSDWNRHDVRFEFEFLNLSEI